MPPTQYVRYLGVDVRRDRSPHGGPVRQAISTARCDGKLGGTIRMQFLWFILIGIVAGWLAGQVMKGGGYGLVGDLIVGVIGALLGGFLFGLLGISAGGLLGSLVTATLGAIV